MFKALVLMAALSAVIASKAFLFSKCGYSILAADF